MKNNQIQSYPYNQMEINNSFNLNNSNMQNYNNNFPYQKMMAKSNSFPQWPTNLIQNTLPNNVNQFVNTNNNIKFNVNFNQINGFDEMLKTKTKHLDEEHNLINLEKVKELL
jgi:hypothetical protein